MSEGHWGVLRKLHWHLVRRHPRVLTNLKLLRWRSLRSEVRSSCIRILGTVWHLFSDWRRIEPTFITSQIWPFSLFKIMLCFSILHTLMAWLNIPFDMRSFTNDGFAYFVVTLTIIRIAALILSWDLGLILNFFIVDYGTFFDHAFHGLRFFFEIIAFMNVLNDFLVFVLHVLYLFFEILKLKMKGFYFLDAPGIATLGHWLGNWGMWRIQLGTSTSLPFFHLYY